MAPWCWHPGGGGGEFWKEPKRLTWFFPTNDILVINLMIYLIHDGIYGMIYLIHDGIYGMIYLIHDGIYGMIYLIHDGIYGMIYLYYVMHIVN